MSWQIEGGSWQISPGSAQDETYPTRDEAERFMRLIERGICGGVYGGIGSLRGSRWWENDHYSLAGWGNQSYSHRVKRISR